MPLFDYEDQLYDVLESNKLVFVLKSRGLGISEWSIRYILFKCLTNPSYHNSHVLLISGPAEKLAKELLYRMVRLLDAIPNTILSKTTYELKLPNDITILSIPSMNIDSARGYQDVSFVFGDESSFFNILDDTRVENAILGYVAKSSPTILWVSTPSFPSGFMYNIHTDQLSPYKKLYLNYERGLNKIYTPKEIEEAKKHPSFEQEYNLSWVTGKGNMFGAVITGENDTPQIDSSQIIMAIDPSFGSSKFAFLILQKKQDVIYPIYELELERTNWIDSYNQIIALIKTYNVKEIICDAAHPAPIDQLRKDGYQVQDFNFRTSGSLAVANMVKMVNEGKCIIPKKCKGLLLQVNNAMIGDNGLPDKKYMNYDLLDCLAMGVNFLMDDTPFLIEI
ncbi:MAG: hypothetical protein WEC35_03280 [Nitrosopumilaceae archaeon]